MHLAVFVVRALILCASSKTMRSHSTVCRSESDRSTASGSSPAAASSEAERDSVSRFTGRRVAASPRANATASCASRSSPAASTASGSHSSSSLSSSALLFFFRFPSGAGFARVGLARAFFPAAAGGGGFPRRRLGRDEAAAAASRSSASRLETSIATRSMASSSASPSDFAGVVSPTICTSESESSASPPPPEGFRLALIAPSYMDIAGLPALVISSR
mmetsp:Transcript_15251/g.65312  ORF Transcript_15251/g.65312 Transcript_15251/m.65312 type:complete len:219 (+) Transcript_15251:1741-2397(+)